MQDDVTKKAIDLSLAATVITHNNGDGEDDTRAFVLLDPRSGIDIYKLIDCPETDIADRAMRAKSDDHPPVFSIYRMGYNATRDFLYCCSVRVVSDHNVFLTQTSGAVEFQFFGAIEHIASMVQGAGWCLEGVGNMPPNIPDTLHAVIWVEPEAVPVLVDAAAMPGHHPTCTLRYPIDSVGVMLKPLNEGDDDVE